MSDSESASGSSASGSDSESDRREPTPPRKREPTPPPKKKAKKDKSGGKSSSKRKHDDEPAKATSSAGNSKKAKKPSSKGPTEELLVNTNITNTAVSIYHKSNCVTDQCDGGLTIYKENRRSTAFIKIACDKNVIPVIVKNADKCLLEQSSAPDNFIIVLSDTMSTHVRFVPAFFAVGIIEVD
jgi:hypothetical protein